MKKEKFKKTNLTEDELYYIIGTEDGYFDHIDIKKYIRLKEKCDIS